MKETRFGVRQENYGPTDYLQEHVLPALFERLDLAFPEFGWQRRGRGWEATNQEHTRGARVFCHSPQCYVVENGEAKSWTSYVNGGRPPRGREILTAARSLSAIAGVDLAVLERDLLPGEADRYEGADRRRTLLETFGSFAHAALLGNRGRYARSHLIDKRGFTSEEIESGPLGLYPSINDVTEYFSRLKIGLEEVRELGLLPPAHEGTASTVHFWPGRIVGLWRDRWGNAESCWALDIMRTPTSSGSFPAQPLDELESFLVSAGEAPQADEYLSLSGTRHDSLVATGLEVALQGREGLENLVLMERPLDALYLQTRGFPNVAAICGPGGDMNRARWERLASFGVRAVTLALSNDLQEDGRWPGREGTLAAIESTLKVANVPAVFVIDPAQLGASLDLGEVVRFARGSLDGVHELLKGRAHAYRYKALTIIEKHKPEAEWSDVGKAAAIDEALDFDGSVTVREKFPDLDLFFWHEILAQTGAGADAVRAKRDAVREKRGREALRRAYEELLADAGRTLQTRRLEDVKGLLRERVERLQAEERVVRADPVLSVAEELAVHESRLAPFRGADLLGLPQRTLRSLDVATLGLRGLVLLAAGPATGKTSLALQLGVDAVRANPDACFVFVSMEMPRWDLMTRLKCGLAGLEWKTLVFGSVKPTAGSAPGAVFRPEETAALLQADKRLEEVGRRMRFLDERSFPEPTVDRVLEQVDDLKARTGCKRALVAVDFLQVWPIPEPEARGLRTDQDADRFRLGAMKSLRDALNGDPVLVVSEARRSPGPSGEPWTAAFADPAGSARGPNTPDIVLLLRPFGDADLAMAYRLVRERDGRSEMDPQKVAEMRESLRTQGKAYQKLEIAKGRDGVLRGTLDVTFWFRRCRFDEGRK